ncbi:MAG: hypothetical protein RLZZ126_236 [Pseudomonadota bacterium]
MTAMPTDQDESGHSRYAQRVRRRYEAQMALLAPGVPTRDSMASVYAVLLKSAADWASALRVTRHLVMERLIRLDVTTQAGLHDVCAAVTDLAEFAVQTALDESAALLDATHGAPCNAEGQRTPFWVVGMGKLGGRELNVSSDIDLIYVYGDDGQTTGRADGTGRIGNQEYFARMARHLQRGLAEVTADGFVFRLDLALRPNGNSGPPAVSLDALEEYFQVQGREWERFAWLKARALTDAAPQVVQRLRRVVVPFVFRRYLDYGMLDGLRGLHQQIRQTAEAAGVLGGQRGQNVKLGRGGIREIEFFVQLMQVVRGGQFPELRTRPTLAALQRIRDASLASPEVTARLAAAYTFLRNVEHRIQYLDDEQTHSLPPAGPDLDWIARTMGCADTGAFVRQLQDHCDLVAREFEGLLAASGSSGKPSQDPSAADGPTQAFRVQAQTLLERPLCQMLREAPRRRLDALIASTDALLAAGEVSELAGIRFLSWVEQLLRRDSYLALLVERPQVLLRVLRVLQASRWSARYLTQHPGVIDELAHPEMLAETPSAAKLAQDLAQRKRSLQKSDEDGEEALLRLLRQAHHAETFRTLVRDVEGHITVEQVADELSALADTLLQTATQWCWEKLRQRHREDARIGIVAYGKLGGKELGYGSDLDIVFLYDDDDPRAPEAYAALARKLIQWLTLKTQDGDLYEIDTALRPNGSSGLLVSTLDSFEAYQLQRGSNTAWTWEHQAMTRARFLFGPSGMGERFDQIRYAVLTAERSTAALGPEIAAMRERVRAAHAVPAGQFDVKHSVGAMMDVEFIVQQLVLAHSRSHPALIPNLGNIALLQIAGDSACIPADMALAAANAYREFRALQHRARLDESPALADLQDENIRLHREAVTLLWSRVFQEIKSND